LHLDSTQEKMLRGDMGEARRFAMEIVSKVGDSVRADSLVPIKSAHVLAHYSSLHDAGVDLLEHFANTGGKFAVPTSVDPASIDLQNWRSFGIPEEYARQQFRLCEAFDRMGGMRCWTCVQYQVCNIPKRGDDLAWSESSAVVFANSVLGCRSNSVTAGMDVACAILGLTPRFGMLVEENRRATVSFRLNLNDMTDLDFRSIGFFMGRNSGERVPALEGLPALVTSDQIKHLGAASAAAGPVTMIHFLGITPGSRNLSEATGGARVEEIEIERSDLNMVESDLNQTSETPDLVAFGVPHLSINELGELVRLLEGKRVKKGVKMYAYTSSQAYDMARRSGISTAIERAGARISSGTDAEISPLKMLGFNTVMTNSAKLAEIVSSEGEIRIRYCSQKEIIEEVAR
jgi:predicted aconitase